MVVVVCLVLVSVRGSGRRDVASTLIPTQARTRSHSHTSTRVSTCIQKYTPLTPHGHTNVGNSLRPDPNTSRREYMLSLFHVYEIHIIILMQLTHDTEGIAHTYLSAKLPVVEMKSSVKKKKKILVPDCSCIHYQK